MRSFREGKNYEGITVDARKQRKELSLKNTGS